MKRVVLMLVLLAGVLISNTAHAQEGTPCPLSSSIDCIGPDGLTISRESEQPAGPSRDPQAASAGSSASLPPPRLTFLPACPGNFPGAANDLCVAVTASCPLPEQTEYWVFVEAYGQTTGVYGPPVRRSGSVCLAPAEVPGPVDPRIAVSALVQRDWQTFGLPVGTVVSRPPQDALVNVGTLFLPGTPRSTVLLGDVLGQPVRLTVEAVSWVWDFGDGSVPVRVPAGSGLTPEVLHAFGQPGSFGVSVAVEYEGSYTIGADPAVLRVQGTATVPGQAAQLVVREARTQLEGG